MYKYKFSIITGKEQYSRLLKNELIEEANEYIQDENQEEIADILEVIDAIIKFNNFDKAEILAIKEKKKLERGGFEKRILMEYVDY